MDVRKQIRQEAVLSAFNRLDADGSGSISAEDGVHQHSVRGPRSVPFFVEEGVLGYYKAKQVLICTHG